MAVLTNKPNRAALLTLCGLSSALVGLDAAAQEAARSSADVLMEEIIVTARKREESLQDAPIAVSAFSGDSLTVRGVTQLDAVADFTPNLVIQNNPSFGGASNNASIFIRGIGQADFIPTVDPGVGIYVDGVYVARSVGAVLDLVDIERVEILRGPQGTLFGRNTIGGAINITTVAPQDELTAEVQATVGADERIDARLTANIPLSNRVFSRFTVATFNQDGYVERISDGVELGDEQTFAARGSLRFLPSDSFTIDIDVDYTRTRENGPPVTLEAISFESQIFNPVDANGLLDPTQLPMSMADVLALVPIDNFALLNNFLATFVGGQDCLTLTPGQTPDFGGNPNNPACFNSQFIFDGDRSAGTFLRKTELDVIGANLTLAWQVNPALELKSITAYRNLDSEFGRDFDQSPLIIAHLLDELDQEQFTQEVQAIADFLDGRLRTVIGGYYLFEDGDNPNELDFVPVNFLSGGAFETENWAIFAQATFDILEALHLTVGGRYTDERKSFAPDQFIFVDRTLGIRPDGSIGPLFGVGTRILPPGEVRTGIEEFTPMVNLAFDVSPELMVYGTYSEGFKSGGFNQRVFPPLPEVPDFEPEFVDSFELGFKFSGFDNRLRLNAAAYYTEYDNLQVTIFREVAPVTSNAAKAEIQGFEVELLTVPVPNLAIEASVGLTDAEFTEVDPEATQITLDSEFERVPEWTANAAVSYDIALADGWGHITPRLQWTHRSSYFNDPLNRPEIREDGYHLFDFLARWESEDRDFFVQAGVENFTDERFRAGGVFFQQGGILQSLFNRGREWFLRAGARF